MASEIAKSREPFFKAPRQFKKRGPNGFPIGPRTERRAKENAKLRNLGIRHCELGISPYCSKTSGLTWCHASKSRYLVTSKDWQTACRGCLACHQHIEALSPKEMTRLVNEAIGRRTKL